MLKSGLVSRNALIFPHIPWEHSQQQMRSHFRKLLVIGMDFEMDFINNTFHTAPLKQYIVHTLVEVAGILYRKLI